MKMFHLKILIIFAIAFVTFDCVQTLPCKNFSRAKRTSDQRLAELETLFALSKMNGKLITVPIGFGKIDPSKLGRKKRSIDLLIRQLVNNSSSAKKKLSEDTFHTIVEPQMDAYAQFGGLGWRENGQSKNVFINDELDLRSSLNLPLKLPD